MACRQSLFYNPNDPYVYMYRSFHLIGNQWTYVKHAYKDDNTLYSIKLMQVWDVQ